MSPTGADTTADADAVTRGRPRDADRTAAILDAAVDVMHDLGWDGFKVQEVATRAGAGLATIYRRWETKEDLIAAAMRHDIDVAALTQPVGTAREQLAAIMTHFGDKMCGNGGSVITVLAAARDHEVMRAALDEAIRDTVRVRLQELLGEILGDGHVQVLSLTDAILGSLIFRAGMLEVDTPGADFAAEMLALADAVARSPHAD